MMLFSRMLALVALLAALPVIAAPSLESLAAAPQYSAAVLSPDGKHLAIAKPDETRSTLVILRSDNLELVSELAFPQNQHVMGFQWANEEMLVVRNGRATGSLGGPSGTGELFSVSVDGSKRVYLFGYRADRSLRQRGRDADYSMAFMISPLPAMPDHVLVGEIDWSSPTGPDFLPKIHRVNVYTGARTQITQAPIARAYISANREGTAFLASGLDDSMQPVAQRYDPRQQRWLSLQEGLSEGGYLRPLGFSSDERAIYAVVSEAGESGCLYRVQLPDLTRERLTCEEHAEPAYLLASSTPGRPLGPWYDTVAPRVHLLEPQSDDAQLYAALSQQMAPASVRLLNFSEDGKLMLFEAFSDRDGGRLFLFDREAQRARFLFARYPGLDADTLGASQPYRFQARDGTLIQGFVTLPPGQPAQGLPMLVMPHGGPYGVRDRWGFDADSQALATRGYAVLTVNFRGSGGRGESFVRQGYRQWGEAIQDDIIDATRWAIDVGLADPQRICIVGASFGAYSALMSAIRAPELYQCAIGYAGVYDLEMMFNRGDIRSTARGRLYLDTVLGRDSEALARQSPAAQAEQLKQPVLLVHGGADQRAPLAHAQAMRRALRAVGNEPQWMMIRDEAHGFFRADNRRRYLERKLSFVAEHIGPGGSAQPAAE